MRLGRKEEDLAPAYLVLAPLPPPPLCWTIFYSVRELLDHRTTRRLWATTNPPFSFVPRILIPNLDGLEDKNLKIYPFRKPIISTLTLGGGMKIMAGNEQAAAFLIGLS